MNNEKVNNLLIVDDEPLLRDALAFDFERLGFNVMQAASGHEGLEKVKTNVVDMVLTDVRMPNGDGIELLDNINKISDQNTLVILMTAFSDIQPDGAFKKGAYGFFTKPYNRKELIEKVKAGFELLRKNA